MTQMLLTEPYVAKTKAFRSAARVTVQLIRAFVFTFVKSMFLS